MAHIFKVLRKDLQPRIFYLVRLSFEIEREIKNFPDKQKLKEFITTKMALQEMLNRLKIFMQTKGIYRFSAITIKIPTVFFSQNWNK